MVGMSEREYAAHAGLSRGAIQKAKTSGRIALHADGSIDAAASDARRAGSTDPSKSRPAKAAASKERLTPLPETAVTPEHHSRRPSPKSAQRCLALT